MNGLNVEEAAHIEAMKKQIMRKILTRDAFERLGRVRTVNPVLALQLETYLIQVYQTGQLKETIDDKKLKQILEALNVKKEIKIKKR